MIEPIKIPIEDVLDLHTYRPEEMPDLLVDYLNACMQTGIYSIRIIHGKGSGILKKKVRSTLKQIPWVSSYKDAPLEAGGWGATIVELSKT